MEHRDGVAIPHIDGDAARCTLVPAHRARYGSKGADARCVSSRPSDIERVEVLPEGARVLMAGTVVSLNDLPGAACDGPDDGTTHRNRGSWGGDRRGERDIRRRGESVSRAEAHRVEPAGE